jgi:hypothetical protein
LNPPSSRPRHSRSNIDIHDYPLRRKSSVDSGKLSPTRKNTAEHADPSGETGSGKQNGKVGRGIDPRLIAVRINWRPHRQRKNPARCKFTFAL